MLKFLTQKLKAQSLNEVQPFHSEEDHDSGTESDEENAELQALEQGMKEETENQGDNTHVLIPVRSSSSPLLTRRPLQLVSNQSPSAPPEIGLKKYTSPHQQPHQESSDFERCSFDYEPTSSVEFENHSSEEELAVLNPQQECLHEFVAPIPINIRDKPLAECRHEFVAPIPINVRDKPLVQVTQQPTVGQREKRKWSQVSQRCSNCSDSSGSSDEEVRDLLSQTPPKPICFSSSPPKGVHKLTNQTRSPRLFLANVSPTAVHLCSVSPRKRHRQTSSSDDSEATVMQRPCLDFDKMQKTTLFRKHVTSHGVTKARVVKIKGFTAGSNSGSTTNSNNNNGAGRSSKCLYDPSVFAFRSISTAAMYSPGLTPVEEPSCAF